MKKLSLFLSLLLIVITSHATGLKGTYTIDPSGSGATNFISFRDALNALNANGLKGSVIFNVADGTYEESLYINPIKGSSKRRTITFQSNSLDSTKVILDSGNCDQTIFINGASYITFREMTISYTAGFVTGDVVQYGGSNHIIMENNILHYKKGSTTPYHEAVLDGDYPDNNYNIVRNNHIIGAWWGIEHNGGGAEVGNEIYNNLLDSVEHCAMHIHLQEGMKMYNNKMKMLFPNSIAMIIADCSDQTYKHRSSYIYNNFVTTDSGNCMYLDNNQALNIYNNSLATLSSDNTISFSSSGLPTMNFKNNIVANFGGGMAMMVSSAGRLRSDYNDLYTNGPVLGQWKSTNCATLSDWQNTTKKDDNSVSGDPKFVSTATNDLHATTSSLIISNDALHINIVKDDIDGDIRNTSTPDIGADEWSNPDSNDVGITSIIVPTKVSCGMDSLIVLVKLHNFGYMSQTNSFNIRATAGGSALIQRFTGTLAPGQDSIVTLNFTPVLNTSLGGTYNFKAYTDLPADYNTSNDTSVASDSFYTVPSSTFYVPPFNCISDSVAFINSSVAAGSQSWFFGDGTTSTLQSPKHIYTLTGTYTVKLTVTSPAGGCQKTSYKTMKVDSCFNTLSGTVSTSTASPLKNSRVYAVQYDSVDTSIVILAKTVTDTGGNYSFSLKDSVVYLIAFPDSAAYPGEIVTWRDTTLTFQHAKAVRMSTAPSTTIVNFSTLSGANNSGTGFISGKLTSCTLCKQDGGTPVAGIKLILIDDKNVCYGITYTDIKGNFSFGKLPLRKYHIWVDKPLVDNLVSPEVTLNSTNSNETNLKLILYPTYLSLDVTTGLQTASEENNTLKIYPNPFQSSTNITYSLVKPSEVNIEVFDLTGRKIATLVSTRQIEGAYSVQFNPQDFVSCANGMYLVKIMIGENVITKQIMLLK